MKQTPLVLSILALAASAVFGILFLTQKNGAKDAPTDETTEVTAQKGAIVWFDMDRVLNEYDMYNDLSTTVNTKAQSIQSEIERRTKNLQNDYNKLQSDYNKGILVSSVAQQRSQKLQDREASLNKFVAEKQQEMAEEQSVMMNQILDAVKTWLDKYNETKQFAMILTAQGSVLPAPVAVGDPDLDITDEVIAGLNDEYVKAKAKGTATETNEE